MRILLASDGSEHSDVAARALLERPWPKDSTVKVLSIAHAPVAPVSPISALPYDSVVPADYALLSKTLSEQATAVATRTLESLRASLLDCHIQVENGDARTEIIRVAEDWHADLIVLGSHGRTGLSRWVLGSVAEYVVRHAPCSVEVVRTRKR